MEIKLSKIKINSGFSIVELVVVIGVVSLLAAITIPQYNQSKNRIKIRSAMAIVDNMRMALAMYSNENFKDLPFVYPVPDPPNHPMANLDDFYSLLSPYIANNPNRDLFGNFISYQIGRDPDLSDASYNGFAEVNRTYYTLTVKAKDLQNTFITATRDSITSIFNGQAVTYP